MLRYTNKIISSMRAGNFLIVVRGYPRRLRKVLRELFLGKKKL